MGVGKTKDECKDWKNKYENEARLHVENLDDLKKKTSHRVLGLEDQINQLNSKLKALEQQKARLQQEANVVIKDFEHSQVTIKELTVKIQNTERRCEDIAIKLREMTNLYEKSDKDSKARAQDIVKLGNELDRAKMDNEGLKRDRSKLEEELARAYKDTDALKIKFEQRVQELELELKKMAKSYDVNMKNKEDEFGGIRKKMIVEIESLTARLHETEAKLKNEVEKIKKKMAVTITELEMSLDASNKSNVQLTNATKAQQQKIMELSAAFEDAKKKLGAAADQNGAYMKTVQLLEADITKIRTVLEQTVTAKKAAEGQIAAMNPKLNELSGLNNTLNNAKVKLEKDLVAVRTEYTDIARELKLADERANKASHDAQHFEGLLREEQAKFVKADNIKKALETEVRSLTVRMEEIETNSVATSRRTIQKMEQRIEELEVLLSTEKKTHVETTTCLHKKERSVKELLLQSEEDRKNILILQESLDKLNEKIKMYKRQLEEQEQISNSNIMRVKKFQRELEAAESRAEEAETSLNSFRSRARVFASTESKRQVEIEEVERQVVVNKSSANVEAKSSNVTSAKIELGGSSSRMERGMSTAYSRAGSMARSSVLRAGSVGRAGSMLRY